MIMIVPMSISTNVYNIYKILLKMHNKYTFHFLFIKQPQDARLDPLLSIAIPLLCS